MIGMASFESVNHLLGKRIPDPVSQINNYLTQSRLIQKILRDICVSYTNDNDKTCNIVLQCKPNDVGFCIQ